VADLTDFMIEQYEKNGTVDDVRAMAAEIRRRRAADLSGGDRAGIRAVLEDVGAFWHGREKDYGPTMKRGVEVLRHLIGDKP
jgi:hypothetical protein